MNTKFYITVIIFIICSVANIPYSSADIPIDERNALIAIYDSTNGDDWTDNTGWKGNAGTECSWYGVTCSNNHVTEINLHQNNLSGNIPIEVSKLPYLILLDLAYNDLTGEIPKEIGQLINLEYLDLDYNHLRGEIPNELANLTNLTYFWLCQNQLKGDFPTWIGNLINLESLCLAGNLLSGSIPTEIGNLINLKYLSLWGNIFYGNIPTEMGNLTKLEKLYMAYCHLIGPIPETMGNLTNLQVLVLMNNNLYGPIPPQLKNLTNLTANGSDFRWNSLCTNDSELSDFLNSKQRDGADWKSSQNPISYPAGDINCDCKVDLNEAINALQITAGNK
ncbi:Leucine-rich repeat-containing protein [Desulfonema limicola]|uniref:Leucine-rich repeat-containing protein n=1 Tax=Desulfonema limicola TaxID=45656 RepID=A0A975B8B6_9BACT|nr:hypothetical protein [Desulfonema limicola]QTA80854.1 Leucine-rich repeat-containing protein [Desulfonema limicola]